ncbi:hypothetical protein [Fusobacterium polymorphum]|uniref:hypothetical protein n=1 Tax=Fusobacterium nucleatum subsp. polymorphum TaxID=76857 RepID=UPI00300A94F0
MKTNKNFTIIISVISLIISISSLILGIYQYNKQRKEMAFPYLELHLLKTNSIDFMVENIGNGTAKDIEILYEINQENYYKDENNNRYYIIDNNLNSNKIYIEETLFNLKEENTFSLKSGSQKEIKVDHNTASINNLFLESKKKLHDISQTDNIITIKIKYYDLFNREYNQVYRLAIIDYLNVSEFKLLSYKLLKVN